MPEVKEWFDALPERDARKIAHAFDVLVRGGPTQGRPHVDRIRSSNIHRMKEVRCTGNHVRALFVFEGGDHGPRAIVLAAGSKQGRWNRWYRDNIKTAERRYAQHQRDTRGEHRWHPIARSTGSRSAGLDR